MFKQRPILGITMGDPAGVGPEIAAKALNHAKVYDMCKPLVIGDNKVMNDAVRIAGLPLKINTVSKVREAIFQYGTIDLIDLNNVDMNRLEYGKVSAMAGNAAFEAVRKVIRLALDKKIDVIITGPINKESINLAGHHYSGHTEILAHFTQTKDYSMMLVYNNFRVVHVSTHVSLREACNCVKKERVLKVIKLADAACKKIGILFPRVGVAGLNPHAGENCLFGYEERDEIIPAVEEARLLGINVQGPIAPDTIYPKAIGGWYDIVVSMYHDQGHIPLKAIGFSWNVKNGIWDSIGGVNITLGLPIIRSSVDHGTAFDIAGNGTASEFSMIHAIEYGVMLALNG